MRVVDLKALAKEQGLRGYSRLKKAELIAFIRNNLQMCTKPPPIPAPRPPPRPIPALRPPLRPLPAPRPPPRLIPAPRPPPKPIPAPRPPPRPIPAPRPLVGPKQPELRPYQLKPKRGKLIEPPMEQRAPTNPKQIKCMKKKLDELNSKIRHSKNKDNGLIHKRNSLRRVIEELKWGTRQPTIECRQGFVERE